MDNMQYATILGYYAQLLGQTKMFYNKLDEMYMVIDPVTGDGAYLISGGGIGGFVHLVGLLIASVGGYVDGFSSKKHNLYVNTPLRNLSLLFSIRTRNQYYV